MKRWTKILPGVVLLLASTLAAAQAFPTKPIHIVVPYPAGGGTDIVARMLAGPLREMLGKERDRVDKLWLVTDDVPLQPALRDALAQSPAMRVLRVPHAALAQWLTPAPGESLDRHLYIVDPLGHWMMRAPVDPDPPKLKRDLEKLLRASASWDRPGR